MNIIINGKQKRFLSANLGSVDIQSIWQGDKQIWPATEGVARRIVVKLPEEGTRDWQYWVHALDATLYEAAPNNYMKFSHAGMDYYLQQSFDGSPPYKVQGNVLILENYDGILIDQLGAELVVEAKIASRNTPIGGGFRNGTIEEKTISLPILQGTISQWTQYGYKSGAHTRMYETYISKPSETYLLHNKETYKSGRTARTYGSNIPAADVGDTSTFIQLWFAVSKHSGGASGYRIIHPAFTYKFKLPIISVE